MANVSLTVATLLVTGCIYLFTVVYRNRSKINKLRKQGVPMPREWSWATGHLLTLQKYVDKLPPDANVSLALKDLCDDFHETEMFLMDFWPVYPPFFVTYSPEICSQVTSQYNLAKTEQVGRSLMPITGGRSMISMNGEEWKRWRSLFNPGFSAASITGNIPHIVDCVELFREKLLKHANNTILCLDDLTTRLTMDVIIKVTLDTNLDYQRSENELATALGYITRWHSFWDPRILMHPLRPLIQWYYGRKMDNYIRAELGKRYQEVIAARDRSSTCNKSVIALAIKAYVAEQTPKGTCPPELDEHFAASAAHQIRLFLFAGNDTTSSSIVYTYHLLHKNPNALQKLQEEHDKVFGTDASKAATLLKQKPELLNQCKFTSAVIKETLRLYAPASTMRAPRAGVVIRDRCNNPYPMDVIGANVVHTAVHTNPRVWPRPSEFLPERFMVDASHALYPNPSAFRPFEQGPRACIGQTLVHAEMKTVLVLTARSLMIEPAYEQWDVMQLQKESWLKKLGRTIGIVKDSPRSVNGDRAYQTEKAGSHPAEGYPCHVKLL